MLDEKTKKLLEDIAEKTEETLRQVGVRKLSEESGLIEKEAKDQSTGMSQYKLQKTKTKKKHLGTGSAIGAALGGGAGALTPGKFRGFAAAAGAIGGGLIGRKWAKHSPDITKTKRREGVVKQQERGTDAKVPQLTDGKVMKFLNGRKRGHGKRLSYLKDAKS